MQEFENTAAPAKAPVSADEPASEIRRLREQLDQKLAEVVALRETVESAINWQKKWHKRVFHRWRPPGQKRARKGIFGKVKQSFSKRFDERASKFRSVAFIAVLRRVLRRKRPLEIEVITMMYNEAFLVPLYVRHYAPWVDKFTVFYNESTDGTRNELERAAAECGVKSLNIVPFEFPNGFDDVQKIERINQAVRESTADFVICVDTDEFVHPWPFESTSPRVELAKESGDVVYCAMFQSYRHVTDVDIDRTTPPLFQRRHGDPDFYFNLEGKRILLKDIYTKPCIVRPESGAQFTLGCHGLLAQKDGSTKWRGVHWGRADDFCVLRYVRDRRDRFSEENRRNNRGVHLFGVTEQTILAELKAHENDPKLF